MIQQQVFKEELATLNPLFCQAKLSAANSCSFITNLLMPCVLFKALVARHKPLIHNLSFFFWLVVILLVCYVVLLLFLWGLVFVLCGFVCLLVFRGTAAILMEGCLKM